MDEARQGPWAALWDRIESIGQRPDDSPKLALAKRTAVRTELTVAMIGLVHYTVVALLLQVWPAVLGGLVGLLAQIVAVWMFAVDGNLRRGLQRFTLKSLFWVFVLRFFLRGIAGSELFLAGALIIALGAALTGNKRVMVRAGGLVAAAIVITELAVWFFPLPLVHLAQPEHFFFVVSCIGAVGVMAILMVTPQTRGRRDLADALEEEHERSERLLLNVLPPPIAERLKTTPGTIADRFEEATVLFADIVGFTPLSSRLSPEELVRHLDEIFSEFDRLAEHHGLEKIKTIGDAYMVAGGIPEPRADHVEAVARMALEMREAAARWPDLQLRIGLHTGPVVAGVIGQRKFSYDLWGDTVNVASRMESHGTPGAIHVTDAVRAALDGHFAFENPRQVEVKGKGEMQTWHLAGPRESATLPA